MVPHLVLFVCIKVRMVNRRGLESSHREDDSIAGARRRLLSVLPQAAFEGRDRGHQVSRTRGRSRKLVSGQHGHHRLPYPGRVDGK